MEGLEGSTARGLWGQQPQSRGGGGGAWCGRNGEESQGGPRRVQRAVGGGVLPLYLQEASGSHLG